MDPGLLVRPMASDRADDMSSAPRVETRSIEGLCTRSTNLRCYRNVSSAFVILSAELGAEHDSFVQWSNAVSSMTVGARHDELAI